MSKRDRLLEHARRAPHQLQFADAIWLAENRGFQYARTKGSHTMFKRPGFPKLLNFQNVDGYVLAYQTRQLLAAIDALDDHTP